jgi:uncharacterized protein YbjT (DUF2867 family)
MILVTGAAGKTGKAIVEALAAKGAAVRALVRRPEHIDALKRCGAAEVSVGSYEDADAIGAAVAGTQAIYHICPNVSPHEFDYARSIAAAAQAHGVTRFVYHSVLHPQIEAMPHHWQKARVEQMLFAAGLDLTILQPTAYMQNLLGAWRGIVEAGVFRIPYPAETRLSLVDLNDVAEIAAIVVMNEGHGGATYELVGTTPLSQSEVAATIGAALQKTIRIDVETVEVWEARASAAGMGDYEVRTLAAMFRYYTEHGLIGNSNALRWLLGHAPQSLASFVGRISAHL